MSNTARKARKRAGIKFERTPKVGTLLTERAWYNGLIPERDGHGRATVRFVPRSIGKRRRALHARLLDKEVSV